MINEKIDLCGANLSGDNKLYYDNFWKCKYNKSDVSTHYNPNKNWVTYTLDNSDNSCMERDDYVSLLPETVNLRKSEYVPDVSNMRNGEWPDL
jgi:hypothetical protein